MPAGKTYEPIATTTLGSASSSITFSSLGTYTDLRLVLNLRSTTTSGNVTNGLIRFNSSTSGYSRVFITGNGSTISATRNGGLDYIYFNWVPTANATANYFGNAIVDILEYRNTNNVKQANLLVSYGGSSTADNIVNRQCATWNSTSAITDIAISVQTGNLATDSSATVYGITKA